VVLMSVVLTMSVEALQISEMPSCGVCSVAGEPKWCLAKIGFDV
jgi:hypothetical protein